MNDALREAAAVDPGWAKKEARRQFILKLTVAGTLVALAVGAISFGLGVHNSNEITKVKTRVEHSACEEDAAGADCQRAKREAARAANLATTCIPFFKAGYPCPKPGSTAAQRQVRRQSQAGSGSAERLDGEPAPESTGTTGGVKAPKGDSTNPPAPGKGGKHGGAAPAKPPAAGPAAPPPSSTTPAATAEAITEEARPPANPAASNAPGLIGNPGGVVGETVCSATNAVNELAGVRACGN